MNSKAPVGPSTSSFKPKSTTDVDIKIPSIRRRPTLNSRSQDVDIHAKAYDPPSRTKLVAFLSSMGFFMACTMGLSGLSLYYLWELMKANEKWNLILDERQKFPVDVLKNDFAFGGKKLNEIQEISSVLKPAIRQYLHRQDPTHLIVFYVVSVFLGILLIHFILFLAIKRFRLNFQMTAVLYALDALVLFCAGAALVLALTRANLRLLRGRIFFERTSDPGGNHTSCIRISVDKQAVDSYHELEEQDDVEPQAVPDPSSHGRRRKRSQSITFDLPPNRHPPTYCCHVKRIANKTSQNLLFALIKSCAYATTKKNPRDPCRNVTIPGLILERKGTKREYSSEDLTALLVCPDNNRQEMIIYIIAGAFMSAVVGVWITSYAKHNILQPDYWKKLLTPHESSQFKGMSARKRIPSFMQTDLDTVDETVVDIVPRLSIKEYLEPPIHSSRSKICIHDYNRRHSSFSEDKGPLVPPVSPPDTSPENPTLALPKNKRKEVEEKPKEIRPWTVMKGEVLKEK